MKSELPLQANLLPEYSVNPGEKFIGPTILSGLTLPGLDLPHGTPEPTPASLRAHIESRIELLKQANLSRWHGLRWAAKSSLREASIDFRNARRHVARTGKKLAKNSSPRPIRLLVLTFAAVAALTCEYVLSAPLIGPVFGFEPESWQSLCLGAIIVLCTIAMKYPIDWALVKLRGLISGRKGLEVVTSIMKLVLVCGIVWANFVLVYQLAPLREEAGITFNHMKDTSSLDLIDASGVNHAEIATPTNVTGDQKDAAAQKAAGLAIGLVSVLDSLILCLAVDRTGRHAFQYWVLKHNFNHCRKQRSRDLDRLRAARQHVSHWQYIWNTRGERVQAIADAMRAREECLRSPRITEVPSRVATPVEWVEQTLQMQHQQLPYVN